MSKCMLFCRYSYTVDGVSEPMLHSEIFIRLNFKRIYILAKLFTYFTNP